MEIKFSIEDHIGIIEYERLSMVFIQGILDSRLSELISFGKLEANNDREVGQLKVEENREFLALFYPETPIIDSTIVRTKDGVVSIVNYSLDCKKSKKIASRQSAELELKFQEDVPSSELIDIIGSEFAVVDVRAYDLLDSLNSLPGFDLESLFATTRYANFLHLYKGLTERKSLKLAKERYISSI